MVRIFLLIGLLGMARCLPAQTLSPTLIGSAFAHAVDPSFGSLDWSVGETMVSSYSPAAGPVLTQGFHQVFVSFLTDTREAADNSLRPLVYPNPSHEWVHVDAPESVRVRLLSITGIELLPFDESATFHMLALRQLPAGTYLLEIARNNQPAGQFFKLQIIP